MRKQTTSRKLLLYSVILSLTLMLVLPQFITIIEAQRPKYFFKVTSMMRPPPRSEFIDLLKAEFAKIGIDYELVVLEGPVWSEHSKKTGGTGVTFDEGGYDLSMVMHGWQRLEPGVGYSFYYHSGYQARYMKAPDYPHVPMRWFNPRFDKLFDDMNRELDHEKRKKMIQELSWIVADEIPEVILWQAVHAIPARADMTGFKPIWGGALEYYRSLAFTEIQGKTEADDVTITMAQSAKIKYASSFWQFGVIGFPFVSLMYDPLVDLDSEANPIPGLAKSWDVSEDGLKYTFHLRDNVYWHDGEKFTAEDAKWSIEMLQTPELGYHYTSIAKFPLESMETPDDYTLVINLKEPHVPLLARLAYLHIEAKHHWEGIEVGDMIGHDKAVKGPTVGTGPFKVVKWEPEEYLELAANDNWYGGRPFIDHLFIKFIPEAATALAALEAGEVDMLQWFYTPEISGELDRLDKDPKFQVIKYESGMAEAMYVNCQHPALNNIYVRKAINHIIPREHITKDIMLGLGEPTAQLIASTHWAHNPDIPPPEYNVELAKEYMMKAGYDFELLKPLEIPMSAYYIPVAVAVIIGIAVGAGVTYGLTRKR